MSRFGSRLGYVMHQPPSNVSWKHVRGIYEMTHVYYLDDIIVFSKSFDEHIEHLRKVLQRLKAHGVKLKPKKCTIFKREVLFLGRIVSEEGYKLDPSTVAPILRMKETPPKTVNEVRKLMGFLNYYRWYIETFSRIAKPICDLVKLVDHDKNDANPKRKYLNQPPPNQQISCIGRQPINRPWRGSFNVL